MVKLAKCLSGVLMTLFFGLMVSSPVQATLVEYSVTGEAGGPLANQAGHPLSITGSMIIDDVPAVQGPWPEYGEPFRTFVYSVAGFALNVGQQYAFSGTSGRLTLLEGNAETIWQLYGTGYWSHWMGDQFNYPYPSFFHQDGTPYNTDTDEASQLAPLIHLTGMGPSYSDPQDTIWFADFNSPSQGLFLSAVPIPPSLWLLASGLAGLVGFRRKLRKQEY